jgi:hypothetical protein
MEELKEVVFRMATNKAVGTGFNVEFYLKN